MSQRVTGEMVKEIIDTTLTADEIHPFIQAATLIVDQLTELSYTEDLQREIERWLSAHFVAIRDARTTSVGFGDATASFEGKTGMGLEHTRYGQQAMILDFKGRLAQIMARRRPAEVKTIA